MTTNKKPSYVWKILGGLFLLLVIAVVVGVIELQKRAPALIEKHFVKVFEDSCATCHLKLKAVKLSLIRGPLVFEGVSMQVGKRPYLPLETPMACATS